MYLITYSQADLQKFPTRRAFADVVVNSFGCETETPVVQWACCLEQHRNGGYHFHIAVKLQRCKRWLPSKSYLTQQHSISVHFSSSHDNYYSAWKYVTKEDDDVLESQGHPDLRNKKPPRTAKATRQVRRKPRKRRQSASKPTKTATHRCSRRRRCSILQ